MRRAALGAGFLVPRVRLERRGMGLGVAAALLAIVVVGVLQLPQQETSTPVQPTPVVATPLPLVPGAALPVPERLALLFTRAASVESASGVRFLARGPGFRFGFASDRVFISLAGSGGATTLALDLVGASPDSRLRAAERAPATIADLSAAGAGVAAPTFSRVVYEELWPGIDMIFTGAGGTLKYAFRVAPGASPSDIRLAYRGVRGATLSPGGALLLETPLGRLRDTRPVSEQRAGGQRRAVDTRFVLGDRRQGVVDFGFALGSGYDPARPLLIDPGIVYARLLGGRADEEVRGVALGPGGAIFLTGYTWSSDFPASVGAYDETRNGQEDVFVTKLDPTGSTVLYSTFVGGSRGEGGDGIAVGSDGSAYVTGVTESPDLPTTPGALDRTLSGADTREGFAFRLSPSGSELLYSTFLGGSRDDLAHDVAVDEAGNAYVTGSAWSEDFPTTPGAYDPTYDDTLPDSPDVFVTKLDPSGSTLVYSTFVGAANDDFGQAIGVDGAGNATVVGRTSSAGFPTTPGADDETLDPPEDAFVATLNPSGSALVYSTFLGGGEGEEATAVAVGADGSAFVSGVTASADFPTTSGADQTLGGEADGFVTKVDPTGASLVYSTFVGGSAGDAAVARLDGTGTVYVSGTTWSTDFPVTPDAAQPAPGGDVDAYVVRLGASGAVEYASYLGGGQRDLVADLAVDPVGVLYLVGSQLPTGAASAAATASANWDGSVRTFVAACTIEGTAAAEILTGTSARDVICGEGGDDVVEAGGGNDIVLLGSGGGVARGGSGVDALVGGSGADRLLGGDGRDLLDGGSGGDVLFGGLGGDLLLGRRGADRAQGQGGHDRLIGGDGPDVLRGAGGHDRLDGQAGRDALYGGVGRDRLHAGMGSDLCRGGRGRDVLRACER